MASAVEHALDGLSKQPVDDAENDDGSDEAPYREKPRLFTFNTAEQGEHLGSEVRTWDIAACDAAAGTDGSSRSNEGKKRRHRLELQVRLKPESSPGPKPPPVSEELRRALQQVDRQRLMKLEKGVEPPRQLPRGYFEHSFENSKDVMPWCPDLLVLDILGQFGTIQLEETLGQVRQAMERDEMAMANVKKKGGDLPAWLASKAPKDSPPGGRGRAKTRTLSHTPSRQWRSDSVLPRARSR